MMRIFGGVQQLREVSLVLLAFPSGTIFKWEWEKGFRRHEGGLPWLRIWHDGTVWIHGGR